MAAPAPDSPCLAEMPTLTTYVRCDLCDSDDYEVVYEEKLYRSLQDSDFTVLGEHGEHPRVVRCRNCSLVYANPRDSGEIEQKYTELEIASYLQEERSRMRTYAADVAMLQKHVSAGRVLDVGCSAGLFLSSLPPAFEPYGIEPGVQASEYARKRLGPDSVRQGTLESTTFPEHFFDVVTMWDVIEHLQSPRRALSKVNRLLKDGGLVLLVTPDFGSLTAKVWGRRWPHLIRQHLYYFDRSTLLRLLQMCGFTQIHRGTYTRYFTMRYLLQRLRGSAPAPEKSDGNGFFSRVSVPVNLGDSMLIVARKTGDCSLEIGERDCVT